MNNEILLETIIKDLSDLTQGDSYGDTDEQRIWKMRTIAFEKMRFYQKMLYIINPNNEYGDIERNDQC